MMDDNRFSEQLEMAARQLTAEREYWLRELSDVTGGCGFPADVAGAAGDYDGGELSFSMPDAAYNQLSKMSKGSAHALHVLLTATVGVLLSRYLDIGDIVLGTTIYRQGDSAGKQFSNLCVPLPLIGIPGMTVKALLNTVKAAVKGAMAHYRYPIEILTRELLGAPIDGGQSEKLFDAGVLVENIQALDDFSNYRPNILFLFRSNEGTVDCRIQFNRRLYGDVSMERLRDRFLTLQSELFANPEALVGDIDWMDEGERLQVLESFNNTDAVFDREITIDEWFERTVQQFPDRLAVAGADDGVSLTFGRLRELSHRLAVRLRNLGIKRDSVVAIMAEPSYYLVIGILATLKAGAAYMPVDPLFPRSRWSYMLKDSRADLLLGDSRLLAEVEEEGHRTLALDNEESYEDGEFCSDQNRCQQDLLYVIYTSGTTGKPKGVQLQHGNLVNYVSWFTRFAEITESDKSMLVSSFAFDLGYTALYPTLLNGGSIHILPRDDYMDPEILLEYVDRRRITYLKMTPSMFNVLANSRKFSPSACSSLRLVVLGGEAIVVQDVDTAHKTCPHIRFMNHYGPTEATIGCIARFIDFEDIDDYRRRPTIGTPIANTRVYILDSRQQVRPAGLAGELCIAGEGLARGYLNRPETTEEKFVPDAIRTGQRLYRTGDLARFTNDGMVEFLGRVDHQVKIRGYRIELGEIENRLTDHPSVADTIVVVRGDEPRDKHIVAYIVPKENGIPEAALREELTGFCSDSLPSYMIPTFFVFLDQLPLNANGKVDRRALPQPTMPVELDYQAPADEIEAALVNLWSDLLDIEAAAISAQANFFALGGQSLKATVLAADIQREFSVRVPLTEIFQNPTVAGLAQFVRSAQNEAYVAVRPTEKKDYYELSSAQKRLFVLQQMEPEGTVYNRPKVSFLSQTFERQRFEEAAHRLVKRHETLRTSFLSRGEPVQRVHDNVPLEIESFDLTSAASTEETRALIGAAMKEFIRPFDLSRPPLFRIGLAALPEGRFALMTDMHHIICDGVSQGVMERDFTALLHDEALEPLTVQYRDFSEWQNREKAAGSLERQRDYWLSLFSDSIPVLHLPEDFSRPPIQSYDGDVLRFQLDKRQSDAIQRLALEYEATHFMVLLALFSVLLGKLSGQEDVVTGVPIAGRRQPELQNLIGMFVNTLVLRCAPQDQKSFSQLLKEVKTLTVDAFENQDFQFEDLVEHVVVDRDPSRNPLFDVMFSMMDLRHQTGASEIASETNGGAGASREAKFDLTLSAGESGGLFYFTFEYCVRLFKRDTIQRFADYFKRIIELATAAPDALLGTVSLLNHHERQRILNEFNDTAAEAAEPRIMHRLISRQSARTPDAVAVIQEDKFVTYHCLEEDSNIAAAVLQTKGVRPDDIIGVGGRRGISMLTGILAILKAGGAYLPINDHLPSERIQYMLRDCNARLMLAADTNDMSGFAAVDVDVLTVEALKETLDPPSEIEDIVTPDALAYVIYTSGSTGKAKGVAVHHDALVNTVTWFNRRYGVSPRDRVLQATNIAFDVSLEEIFASLAAGAALIVMDSLANYGRDELLQTLRVFGPTIAQFVPLVLSELLGNCPKLESIRVLICGGDRLDEKLKDRIVGLGYHLHNHYGPTETCVDALAAACGPGKVVIGRPIANSRSYIMRQDCLQPVGLAGELCVAGRNVARGYLNNPEGTHELFGSDPFTPGERMYRTGDLARYTADGTVDFLGRIDSQVKIRGFRIELGEIENALLAHSHVAEAVVIDRLDHRGEKYLAAYLVVRDAADNETIDRLKDDLAGQLPAYMIPPYFTVLDHIPLTANGKVDRRALPEPVLHQEEIAPPRSETERALVSIWADVLQIDGREIGVETSFFQLGGHSLKATVLVSRIQRDLQVAVSLADIFSHPTIRGLAARIESVGSQLFTAVPPSEKRDYYPLSSAQKRLFILHRMDPNSTAYNLRNVSLLNGCPDMETLQRVFETLMARHESFRTAFVAVGEEPVQRVMDEVRFELQILDGPTGPNSGLPELVAEFVRPFDLSRPPLLRAAIAPVNRDSYFLLVDMHHIVSDGTSMEMLAREVERIMAGETLTRQRIHYRDYALWQGSEDVAAGLQRQKTYWLRQYADDIPVLQLPYDFPRPAIQSFSGEALGFTVNARRSRALMEIAEAEGATLYMTLLSVFSILLARLGNAEDVVVGSPVAGRRHADLETIIGMFVNTLSMRVLPEATLSFADFLSQVRARALEAFENQDYQFEELVDILDIKRDAGRNPLFDMMFALQNVGAIPEGAGDSEDSDGVRQLGARVARFDMTWNAFQQGNQLFIVVEYCTALFREQTVRRFIDYFLRIVDAVAGNRDISLGAIDMLPEDERKTVLETFNDTASDFPDQTTINDFLEDHLRQRPHRAAAVYRDEHVSYRGLTARADALAAELRAAGMGTGNIVAIMARPSLDMMVGIVGILRCGAAFLPMDPAYPDSRVRFMMADSGATIACCQRELNSRFSPEFRTIFLEEMANGADGEQSTVTPSPEDIAYIIYTSGSTGIPKGVAIEQRSLVNMVTWHKRAYELTEDDHASKLAGFGFDATVLEIFPFFACGATVYFLPPEDILDLARLHRFFVRHSITSSFLPTQLCEQYMKEYDNPDLRVVLTGGDRLREFNPRRFTLVNNYGPTENTVVSTFLEVDGKRPSFPIGPPVANTRAYILGAGNAPQPVGTTGELCLAGVQLARGYLNRPELTDEKFVTDPFHDGERMYRSGDLARWLPDGAIEFLGRIDQQVKIRGLRIELGEIENQLLRLPTVKNAVVVARENSDHEKYLCAYIVPTDAFDRQTAISSLAERMPDYMIPTHIVELTEIPITPNGKVDLRALPEPELDMGTEMVSPADAVEERLMSIWEELLSLEPGSVGTTADFFRIGGHSLRATMLVGRIHRAFGVEVPLTEIFRAPTIQGIAAFIRASEQQRFQAIAPVEKKDYYRLSSAQKRLFILQRLDPGSTVYNIPRITRIGTSVAAERVEEVFRQLIQRHESFRTSFTTVDEEPVQRVRSHVDFFLQRFSGEAPEDVVAQFVRPFALDRPPLLRVGLMDGGEAGDVLLVDMHHIISDGASMDVLVAEFQQLSGNETLAPNNIHYKDFAEWLDREPERERIQRQGEFWNSQFDGEIPVLRLPYDAPRPAVQRFEGHSMGFSVSTEQTRQLTRLATENNTTPFMLLLGIFSVLMGKLSNQQEIVVGTPVAGRRHPDLERMVGMFVNTLAIPLFPAGGKQFSDFLQEVKHASLQAFENQDYPFEELVDQVVRERDAGRNPLFDVMFAYQTAADRSPAVRDDAGSGATDIQEFGSNVSRFDMTWTAQQRGSRLSFGVEYCTHLFARETVRRFIHYFKRLVEEIVATPSAQLYELELLPDEERRTVLESFNDTAAEVPEGITVHHYLELHRNTRPHSAAVIFEDATLTYEELMKRGGRMAASLRQQGVGRGCIVGILTEPSIEMMIGVVAVLSAGAAFLPIDHRYPDSRIAFMLKDSGSSVALCQRKLEERLPAAFDRMILEDPSGHETGGTELAVSHHPLDLAYIIYTSGSTGTPKGVMIEHRALLNMLTWHNRLFSVTSEDRASKYAGFGFDASIYETFPCLVSGGAIVVVPAEIRLDLNLLHRLFLRQRITIAFLPTQVCERYNQGFDNPRLRVLHAGGDKLRDFVSRSYKLVNNYGPTECTVVSNMDFLERQHTIIPIGPPVPNTQSYILNEHLRPQPVGVAGELCLSGLQLARGYLNRPELTAERFAPHPFRPGERMYRTGDLARWLPDGNIEFLGRIDFQVKIRGMRVELGEIENRVLALPGVSNAVVMALDTPGHDKYICAYIVPGAEFDREDARARLSSDLPDYMVPAYFVELREIPLTANGKVDRKALPEPEIDLSDSYTAPTGELEQRLAAVWADILSIDVDSISMDADFFKLGGHSLRATIMAGRVQRETGVEIPLTQIFKDPTLRGLAAFVRDADGGEFGVIPPAEKKDYYAVTSAQRRLYAVQQADLDSVAYNIPNVIRVPDSIDSHRLKQTFGQLIRRHNSFRTSFATVAGEPVQRIHDTVDFSIEERDVSLEQLPMAIESFVRPFELSRAPLLRAGLLRSAQGQCRLLVDMHHIISDGSSMEVLVGDFMALYNAEPLPEVRVQYQDYAEWMNREEMIAQIDRQEAFWLKTFAGSRSEAELPLDFPRPETQSFAGRTQLFHLDNIVAGGLQQIATQENATLFMALTAILNVVLAKLSGVHDIVIGTPLAGRRHPDLERIIGMFINTVALLNHPRPELTFAEFFKEVKERTLEAFENQEYPFESLVDRLGLKRDRSRNPLFDVVLALQNVNRPVMTATDNPTPRRRDSEPGSAGEFEISTAKFDITILVSQEGDGLSVAFQYRSQLFKQETIERFFGYFSQVAEAVINNPEITLEEIDISHGLVAVEEEMPEAEFDF